MCHFINEIDISEEFKYIIKLCQILSVRALFDELKQMEFLGVIKMGSSYIDNYERNLIMKNNFKIACKMKADGFNSEVIFKYLGVKL